MAGRAATVRASLAGVLAAGAVLLALGGPARGDGENSGAGAVGAQRAAAPAGDDPAAAGRAVLARMGCGGCHRLAAAASVAPVAPDLDEVLPNYDAALLRAKIADPYPNGADPSFLQMPRDFGRRMSGRELDELVEFLLATTRD